MDKEIYTFICSKTGEMKSLPLSKDAYNQIKYDLVNKKISFKDIGIELKVEKPKFKNK